MTMNSKKLMPVFENGMAQPVFPFTDGKTGVAYDAKTSDIVRFCVYVEANFDTNGDGKGDLIKAFVQVPCGRGQLQSRFRVRGASVLRRRKCRRLRPHERGGRKRLSGTGFHENQLFSGTGKSEQVHQHDGSGGEGRPGGLALPGPRKRRCNVLREHRCL